MKIHVATRRTSTLRRITIYCRRLFNNSSSSSSATTADVDGGKQRFKTVFYQLASTNVDDFRQHFNNTAHLLCNNVSISDELVLLKFFYGSVVHQFEHSFVKFVDQWWREIHPFVVRSMDVEHVSTILFHLGRINCQQSFAVRRKLTRNDVRHCEQRLILSCANENYIMDSRILRQATCGLVNLMLPTDIDYPTEYLVTLTMDYLKTMDDVHHDVVKNKNLIDHAAALHLANCSGVLLNLTLMGIRADDQCFRCIIETLKSYNFIYIHKQKDRISSTKILLSLLVASEQFAQSCSLADLNADEISPHCWTVWLMDCEGHLNLIQRLLLAKDNNNNFELQSDQNIIKSYLLIILEISTKYERTREFKEMFELWHNVLMILIDRNGGHGLFLPRHVAKGVVERLQVFKTRTKTLAPLEIHLHERINQLNIILLEPK